MNPIDGTISAIPLPSSTTAATVAATTVPVTLTDVDGTLVLTLQGKDFALSFANSQTPIPILPQGQQAALELQGPLTEAVQGKVSQLLLLAPAVQLKLPDALLQLATQNGVSLPQLQQLAARPQGYPLPPISAYGNSAQFVGGPSFTLPNDVKLPEGQYLAKIIATPNQGLQLQLQPIIQRTEVSLAPFTPLPITAENEQAMVQVLAKPAMANVLSHWLKQLDQSQTTNTAVAAAATNKSNLTTSNSNTISGLGSHPVMDVDNPTTESLNYLQKALNKLGAIPRNELQALETRPNTTSELLKLLPALASRPMAALALPQVLSSELSRSLMFRPELAIANPNASQADTIGTLLQLLLGVRANAQNIPLSSKLRQYLQGLQQRSGIGQQLLASLAEEHSLGSINRLSQTLKLYQQAGAESNGQCWYASLPYYVDQRQEQLEAKFEYPRDDEQGATKQTHWRLQLKFNLSAGALLIKAHMHHGSVDLQFVGNSQQLMTKVSQHFAPLEQKLVQLGLTPGQLSAQVAPVPATLLPGDHYLVQLKI